MKYLIYLSFLLLFISCESKKTDNNKKKVTVREETAEKDTVLSIEKSTPTPFLGKAAQIVIGTPNYSETVRFYELLGWKTQFHEETPLKWSILYDGSTVLMVNEDTASYMGLGYHSSNAEKVYSKLETDGISPMMSINNPETGDVWFNVYAAPDSIGFSVVNEAMEMMEVENSGSIFSAPMGTAKFGFPNPIVGSFQEFAMSVENLDTSIAFWENLGFENNGINTEPYSYTIMYDGLMILGLHETKGMWHGTAFTYSGHGIEQNQAALKAVQDARFAEGVEAMKYGEMVMEGNFLIPDPAGNMFMLTTDLTMLKK